VSGHGRFVSKLDVSTAKPDAGNAALAYLWARAKISELSDFYREDANKKDVIALGLQYNLLTKFTSFIAVQDVVRAKQPGVDVAQPLPLPDGVNDSAVAYSSGPGMSVGDEPPLAIIVLLVVVGIAAAKLRGRLRRMAA